MPSVRAGGGFPYLRSRPFHRQGDQEDFRSARSRTTPTSESPRFAPPLAAIATAALLLLGTPCHAQTRAIGVVRISVDDGLSESAVTQIVQDSRGFMWFGTQDGLNRYDGHSFRVYRNDPADSTSLSDNYITALGLDPGGSIWVGTNSGGLDRLDPEEGTCRRYGQLMAGGPAGPNIAVSSILSDADHGLWVGTAGGGLWHMDPAGAVIRDYFHQPADPGSLSHSTVWALQRDSSGTLWAGTYDGLCRYDAAKDRFIRYRLPANGKQNVPTNISALLVDESGRLWCGCWKVGLFTFDAAKGTFRAAPENPDKGTAEMMQRIVSLASDRGGRLWVGTWNSGVLQIDGRTVTRLSHAADDPRSLSDDAILSTFVDKAGTVWIGTNSSGLNKYSSARTGFRTFRHLARDANSISSDNVWAFAEDRRGNLWVGMHGGGIDKIERASNRVIHDDRLTQGPHSLPSRSIIAIVSDRDGIIWAGSQDAGLFRLDPASRRIRRFVHDPADATSLPNNFIISLHDDGDGKLWVGTYGSGLAVLDKATGRCSTYVHDDRKPDGIGQNTVTTMLRSRDGTMWIGTYSNGLDRFDGKHFRHYRNVAGNLNSLSNDRVLCLHEDTGGVLWIGTWGGGFNRFDPRTETFTRYTQKDGLPNQTVYGILEDDHGNLWLSTNRGLAVFNVSAKTFRVFHADDGLQHEEFNQGAFLRLRDGELLFGGVDGFNRLFPDSVGRNAAPPPVVMTSFRVRGPSSVTGPLLARPDIRIRYDQNFFSFDVAALDYVNPRQNQYAHMLEGFDETWIRTGSDHRVTYTNVPPGEYTIRIAASNNDGVWNWEGVRVHLSIVPPPWKAWWAYLTYVCLTVAGGSWFMRRRARNHAEEIGKHRVALEERERQLAQERITSDALRRTEEALRENEERFRSLYENSTVGLYRTTPGGEILLANPTIVRMLGYDSFEELRSRSLKEGGYEPSYPRQQFIERIEQEGEIRGFDMTWRRRDETILFVRESARAIRDARGETLYYDGTVEDITDQKRAEEALRENETKLRRAQEIAGLGGWEWSPARDQVICSDELLKILCIDAADIVGPTSLFLERLTHPDDRELVREAIDACRRTGIAQPIEHRILTRNGEVRWIRTISELVHHEGQLVKAMGTSQDITERRRVEESLRHAQKLESIGTLAGGIAHDFNNLLNAILGQSALALGKLPKESPAGSNVTKAINAAERAAELTRQLLAYSGKGKFVTEDLDLNHLVRDNVQMLEVSVPKSARLRLELDASAPHIRGDAGQIQQVVMNLIINAGEALGTDPGEITIGTGHVVLGPDDDAFRAYTHEPLAQGEYAFLRVSDTGRGISEEALSRIFDPFYTTKFTGRGLGLAAVLGIVRGHQGGIRIVSRVGSGTQFDVVFPMVTVGTASGAPPATEARMMTGEGMTALVIDDEPFVLDLVRDIFTEAKFEVLGALNPLEGIDLYRKHQDRISVVILDYSMPGMDGRSAFEELRKIRKDVKVLLCSGYTEEETSAAFGDARPAGFIQKPYRPADVMEKIRQILR